MKLSHSATQKYLQCPQKYKLHYIDKIRHCMIGSPLFFGSALDDAFGRLLLTKKKELTPEESELMEKSAVEVYELGMTTTEYNRETVHIPTSPVVEYFKSDFDSDLLEDSDRDEISEFAQKYDIDLESVQVEEFMEEIYALKKRKVTLEVNEKRVYNFICWKSLYNKGLMLLAKYEEEVMPQIHEVMSVQEEVWMEDGDDVFRGYIDFVATFTDDPSTVYVIDNKTSSKPYKDDSVAESEQLSAYCEYKQLRKAAYLVVEKKLRKREPRVRINIIKDEIPEETFENTFSQISQVMSDIKAEKFDKLMDTDEKGEKACFFYGRPCEFLGKCKEGKMDYLVDLSEKE